MLVKILKFDYLINCYTVVITLAQEACSRYSHGNTYTLSYELISAEIKLIWYHDHTSNYLNFLMIWYK